MNVQDAKELTITEGNVRTIHDSLGRQLWGRLAYDTTYNGNTTQQTYSGKNLYNYADISATPSPDITTDSDGWITCSYNNSEGTSTHFSNYFTNPLALTPSTNYALVLEVRSVSGTGSFMGGGSSTQTQINGYTVDFSDMAAGSTIVIPITSKSDVSGVNGLRTYFKFNAGQSGSATVRISVLADTSVTPETFVYQPYTGGVPAPNPDYPQPVNVVTGRQVVALTGVGGESADYEINLGKNLFDKNNPNVIVGTVEAGGYNASGSNKSFYLECESNTTYTIQKRNDGDTNRFIVATANTIPVQGTAMSGLIQKNNDSSVTITTGNDAKYIVCTFYRNTEATLTEQEVIDSIQVEVGSTATSYAAYFKPIELSKIGDYQDYIYKTGDDWYVHSEIGKINSYNSEAISTSYISTTGQLTTGATVYYVLPSSTQTQIADNTLIEQLNIIHEWLTRYGYTATVAGNLPIIISQTTLS